MNRIHMAPKEAAKESIAILRARSKGGVIAGSRTAESSHESGPGFWSKERTDSDSSL